jgi:hypothetical protein
VLEQAHEEAAAPAEGQEGISLEKAMEGLTETPTEPELDTMTKNDLLAEAEKRGLRAKKSSSREQLLTLLRRSTPLQNSGVTAGADGNAAASLDGSANVDLGQGAALE